MTVSFLVFLLPIEMNYLYIILFALCFGSLQAATPLQPISAQAPKTTPFDQQQAKATKISSEKIRRMIATQSEKYSLKKGLKKILNWAPRPKGITFRDILFMGLLVLLVGSLIGLIVSVSLKSEILAAVFGVGLLISLSIVMLMQI
jgi:hypothetical protein